MSCFIGAVGKYRIIGKGEDIGNWVEMSWLGGLNRETIDTEQKECEKPRLLENKASRS